MSERGPLIRFVLWAVVIVFAALAPLFVGKYWINILVLGLISSVVVYSLNFLVGFVGLLSFGQAGFVGIGAYGYGLLTLHGVSPALASLAGVGLSILSGALLGMPAARLRGHYLAIGTLGFGVLVGQFLNNAVGITRGPMGLLGIKSFGWSSSQWYWVALSVSLALMFVLSWIERRTFLGVILKSVKYDEIAARSSGVMIFGVKLGGFCVSAALAGFAGVMTAGYMRFLTPDLFVVNESFRFLMMAVVGGVLSPLGGWISALVLTVLPEWLRNLGESNLRLLVYGVMVLFVLWFLPRGVGGLLEDGGRRLKLDPRAAGKERGHLHE